METSKKTLYGVFNIPEWRDNELSNIVQQIFSKYPSIHKNKIDIINDTLAVITDDNERLYCMHQIGFIYGNLSYNSNL